MMKFEILDARMRSFERAFDQYLPDSSYPVVRLDGRGFRKLTKETLDFERPFDRRFHGAMVATCEHLMLAGIQVLLCYTQSDEISLVLHPGGESFNRKTRKIISILAGEASGKFSLEVGRPVSFDCRLCPLPELSSLIDYLRWRIEDTRRNALSAFCYWTLRSRGVSGREADRRLMGLDPGRKLAFLAAEGIDFEAEEAWKRLGSLLTREQVTLKGTNLLTGEPVMTCRQRLTWLQPFPRDDEIAPLVSRTMPSYHPATWYQLAISSTHCKVPWCSGT